LRGSRGESGWLRSVCSGGSEKEGGCGKRCGSYGSWAALVGHVPHADDLL